MSVVRGPFRSANHLRLGLAKPISTLAVSPAKTGRYRSGQTGRTVNPLAYAFTGSNPVLPNSYRFFFEPPRFFPRADLAPLRFFEPPDFFPRLLLLVDLRALDFFPRALPVRPLALPRAREADAFDFFPPFFAVRFGAAFLRRLFAAARAGFLAFAATFFTAFFAVGAAER